MGWRLLFSGLERLAMTAVGYVAHHSDDHAHNRPTRYIYETTKIA